jgi:integrase
MDVRLTAATQGLLPPPRLYKFASVHHHPSVGSGSDWESEVARERNRLTALDVRHTTEAGLHPDGGGLYLQIGPTGTKSWILKFQLGGRARAMGLGSLHVTGLSQARDARDDAHRLLRDHIDPIEARKAERQQKRLATTKRMTFKEAAILCIAAREKGWRNHRHIRQWPETLATFVYPTIGNLSVEAIDTGLVLKVLEPIWTTIPETASRVRGRIEVILDWAKAREYRQGENPARWRGHLDMILPKKSKVRAVKHHPALPYAQIGTFTAELRRVDTVGALALEFTILTAARSVEVLGATWNEIDLANRLWIVPGERMKSGREHRVPLSDAAIAVLRQMEVIRDGDEVFPGRSRGHLPKRALLLAVYRAGRRDCTVHGFRSTFRDWAAERTNYPGELAEMALAHAVGSKVEAAYRRGDLFEKRRRLMADWAMFCATLPSAVEDNVFNLRGSPIPA